MNELVTQNTELAYDIGFTDEISWVAPPDLSIEQYLAISRTFQQIQKSLSFWYGDLLHAGEEMFGEDFAQAIPDMARASETLLKYKAVAARIPRDIRQKTLGWTAHFYCAYIPEEQRGPLLEIAANVGLSSRELKDVVRLDDDIRHEFILAVQNYVDEEGPMTREVFFPLLNRFRLGDIDEPKEETADDDEDKEGSDDSDNDGVDYSEEVAEDDLLDFWENAGIPITTYSKYGVFWEGISARAAIDGKGKAYIIWEMPEKKEE